MIDANQAAADARPRKGQIYKSLNKQSKSY
jgi:hypothetical protein